MTDLAPGGDLPADPPAGDPPAPPPPAPPAGDPPSDPPADPPAGDPPADPPTDDWRDRLAGDDDKLRGFLGRYQSEKAFVEAAKKDREAARSKLGHKLPDNPTDEELAEYRQQNQIPEKPEGYLEKLPDGLVVGDDDRPFVDVFLGEMHALNAPPALTGAALKAYYNIVEEQAASHSEAVAANKQQNDDALREEWGPDYRRNVNVTDAFLGTLPAEVSSELVNGTDSKGMPLGANANVIKWLAALALEANPLSTVVPGAGSNQVSAIAEEMAAIETRMRTDRTGYNKDEKMQARYRELIEAKMKLEAKG
jgi:hypothetical protein